MTGEALSVSQSDILNTYYADNAKKLHKTVDRILCKFGGLSGKDTDDFYSLANEVFADVIKRYDFLLPDHHVCFRVFPDRDEQIPDFRLFPDNLLRTGRNFCEHLILDTMIFKKGANSLMVLLSLSTPLETAIKQTPFSRKNTSV